jgi:thymidylate synthase
MKFEFDKEGKMQESYSIKTAYIEASSLEDAWFQALSEVMTNGRRYKIDSGSFEGTHRAGRRTLIDIMSPGTRPLAPIMPEGSNIPSPTTEEAIERYSLYLITGEKQGKEHYTYGEDLWWEIEWVIEHLKKAGFGNNHCYMGVGRPEILLLYDLSVDYREVIIVKDYAKKKVIWQRRISNDWNKNPEEKPSSQCLRGIDAWIEDEKLHFWVYFRSWDLWAGFPENLGGIQLVKEYMAERIGVADGIMTVSCKDLHVYEHGWPVALMRLRKETEDTPHKTEEEG